MNNDDELNKLNSNLSEIIKIADKTYWTKFDGKTWFGRCIFLSWYCDVGTCKFCYRSTQKDRIKHKEHAKRSMASIIVEVLLSKLLGWRIEFLTGGYRIFPFEQLVDISRIVSQIYGEKIWINLGALDENQIIKLKPYIEGIVASIETINPELHNSICPNKAIEPYEEMFEKIDKIGGLKKSMTLVIGLGEKEEHFEELKKFISKYKLERITFYALKPVPGTIYTEGPTTEQYIWWISKTRIAFPNIEIIAGTTLRRVEEVEHVLEAGANAITKFPATKSYSSEQARILEKNVKLAGRHFTSTLTDIEKIKTWNWNKEIEELNVDGVNNELKTQIKEVMQNYIKRMMNTSKIKKIEHEEED